MRRALLVIFLVQWFAAGAKAQEVYNLVLNNTARILNSPTSNFTQTQIAQFKRTTLIYMKEKVFAETDTIPSAFLDTQAYFLSEFVTLFCDDIIRCKRLNENRRKERIVVFMDASVSNPLFKDDDTDYTMSYINNGKELTPFCINTNWQKAYAAVKSQLH